MAVATEYATGRRKCAIARAWVTATAGDITVNDQPLEKAFPPLTLRQIIQLPLEKAVPVLETLSVGASIWKKGRLPAFPFFMSTAITTVIIQKDDKNVLPARPQQAKVRGVWLFRYVEGLSAARIQLEGCCRIRTPL
jgi:hypothetical protein